MCFVWSESKEYTYSQNNTYHQSQKHFWVYRHNDKCDKHYEYCGEFVKFGKYVFGFFSHFICLLCII